MMRTLILLAGVATAGLALGPVDSAQAQAKAKAGGKCTTHYGKGWATSLDGAKFQSWEITTQVTGNWPFVTDQLRNITYKCNPDGGGYTCHSKMDVCKS